MGEFRSDRQSAEKLDQEDSIRFAREFFEKPFVKDDSSLYFSGHSLGAKPRSATDAVNEAMEDWARMGIEGIHLARHPWIPYAESCSNILAEIVGAKSSEVIAMNTLTVNLHLMLVSFYRPQGRRNKIVIEDNTFPSDRYAVESQIRFHGLDPKESLIVLKSSGGSKLLEEQEALQELEKVKDEIALILLGNCNYLSGQRFDMELFARKAHEWGAFCGFNLAHGAGNFEMNLHNWKVDFAVWCSYKYLNAGPGGIAAAFVHEDHHSDSIGIPRFEGWWGGKKSKRFLMKDYFEPMDSVEAWQLSNPPIFQLAALRASLEIFQKAGIKNIHAKSQKISAYLEYLIQEECSELIEFVSPLASDTAKKRGTMICVRSKNSGKELRDYLGSKGAIVDFREPDILRLSPCALYTSYVEVFELVQLLKSSRTNGGQ